MRRSSLTDAIAGMAAMVSLISGCDGLPLNAEAEKQGSIADIAKRGVVYYTSTYPANAASMTAIVTPSVVSSTLLGPASQSPAASYISMASAALPSLPAAMNVMSTNVALTQNYAIWNGTGTISSSNATTKLTKPLTTVPNYSRDFGKGGTVNGQHLFIFSDTNSYTAPTSSKAGSWTGAVPNSVAIDVGMLASSGLPIAIQDPVGAMAGPKGASRGFIPLTMGEAAYNNLHNGVSRYAVWPESGLIPLNPTTSLSYAPLEFSNITGGVLTIKSIGMTLSTVTFPTTAGPVANRIVPRLFPVGSIEWGGIGGVRSYGSSGVDGGYVYLFGKVTAGLLLAKAPADSVADVTAYQYYYPGVGWNSTMPVKSKLSGTSCFYNGSFSAVDVFYSPRHLTFIMVYMNNYVDNTLYWRYLKAPQPILPDYAGGNQTDIAQYLTKYTWSSQYTLMKLPTPAASFTYAGGAQLGYFGENDITRGGNQMLFTWTAPTGKAGGTTQTEYLFQSASATFA